MAEGRSLRAVAPCVRVIADRDELMSLEPAYHALFASSHRAHIGTSFPYVIADAGSSRASAGWRLFAAFEGESLVGCLYGRRTKRTAAIDESKPPAAISATRTTIRTTGSARTPRSNTTGAIEMKAHNSPSTTPVPTR